VTIFRCDKWDAVSAESGTCWVVPYGAFRDSPGNTFPIYALVIGNRNSRRKEELIMLEIMLNIIAIIIGDVAQTSSVAPHDRHLYPN
jgi:hypothetical protein